MMTGGTMTLESWLDYKAYFYNYFEKNKEPNINIEEKKEGHQMTSVSIKEKKLNAFVMDFYLSGIHNPNYEKFLEERYIRVNELKDFSCYSKEELYAILTYMVRADRFIEGYLVNKAKEGSLYQILKYLVRLI